MASPLKATIGAPTMVATASIISSRALRAVASVTVTTSSIAFNATSRTVLPNGALLLEITERHRGLAGD